MSMSVSEFEAIGAAIFDADLPDDIREDIALRLADALVSQSDKFYPVAFVRSCGVNGEDLADRVKSFSTRLELRQKAFHAKHLANMEARRAVRA